MRAELFAVLPLLQLGAAALAGECKCTIEDSCWPSVESWNALNSTVSGKLIRNTPPAISCYPGQYYDKSECDYVRSQWYNSTFQSLEPIGYVYPTEEPCPPVDISAGQTAGKCNLGQAPVYTINATTKDDLISGMEFARDNNIRFVVRNTGHDILGKSEGYSALQVWLKYMRDGITIDDTYHPSDQCTKSIWKGAAITISGGYVWSDVYKLAFPKNLIVVGGGDPTVGCIGGYIQGGGHSPASRDYGLATDQILEAQVLLADGRIVTANPCQNSDLYFALRGGGGGTYGIALSMTVKAYPSKPVVAQSLTVSPLRSDTSKLLEAIADLHEAYPAINDAGFSGYGTWSINGPAPIVGNSTVGYVHAVAAMGISLADAKRAFGPLLRKLQAANGTSIFVTVNWLQFPSYPAYYTTMSGAQLSVGTPNMAMTSHMFDKKALVGDRAALREMIGAIAGSPEEMTMMSVELNGGGAVRKPDPLSGLNPAWRSAYMVEVVSRMWASDADAATVKAVKSDISYKKSYAMRKLSPFLGSYLNEADRNDPLWETDFYGTNYLPLSMIKMKYDPNGFFYCPTCVGSSSWYQELLPGKQYGPLCSTGL
ncbi:FAD-binding domain-containing protein [Aspergillus floccosus]